MTKNNNYYKRKRAAAKAGALAGTLEPQYWIVCKECGECFPFYSSYFQNPATRTCPEWLTGKQCGFEYRKRNASRASKGKQIMRRGKGACRKTLCAVPPICSRISKCLDKELASPGAMPLRKDGSCKVPVEFDPPRLHASQYGEGSAYTI